MEFCLKLTPGAGLSLLLDWTEVELCACLPCLGLSFPGSLSREIIVSEGFSDHHQSHELGKHLISFHNPYTVVYIYGISASAGPSGKMSQEL